MKDTLSNIEQKITKLKLRKEKLQTQQAILLFKEVQRILGENFSPELASHILSYAWTSSSDQQQKEWGVEANRSDKIGKDKGGRKNKETFRNSSQRDRDKNHQDTTENYEI